MKHRRGRWICNTQRQQATIAVTIVRRQLAHCLNKSATERCWSPQPKDTQIEHSSFSDLPTKATRFCFRCRSSPVAAQIERLTTGSDDSNAFPSAPRFGGQVSDQLAGRPAHPRTAAEARVLAAAIGQRAPIRCKRSTGDGRCQNPARSRT